VTIRVRLAAALLAAAFAAVVPAAPAAVTQRVKAPRSGDYLGPRVSLSVSGRSIQVAEIHFACRKASGTTVLNDIRFKKSKNRYVFAIRAHGSIGYSDDSPSENGAVDIAGRFSRTGKSAAGVFRVKSSRCRDTGRIKWRAAR
jgi:hypothetical protein